MVLNLIPIYRNFFRWLTRHQLVLVLIPVTRGGRIFAIFFALSAIGMASYAIWALATRV